MFVICSPVGPYYKTGFAPVSLLADPKFVRAWPGGVGQYKVSPVWEAIVFFFFFFWGGGGGGGG